MTVIAQHPPRWRAIPAVAAGCGLHQGEVLGLRVQGLDFLGRKIHVRKQVKKFGGQLALEAPKGGRVPEMPLPAPVADALSAHIAAYPSGEGGVIFTSARGGMVARSTFNQHVWKPALKRAGGEPTRDNGMHPYALITRRCCSTRGRARGRWRTTSATLTGASRSGVHALDAGERGPCPTCRGGRLVELV